MWIGCFHYGGIESVFTSCETPLGDQVVCFALSGGRRERPLNYLGGQLFTAVCPPTLKVIDES